MKPYLNKNRPSYCRGLLLTLLLSATCFGCLAQGEYRYQYPIGLKNAYFGFSLGSIHYDFTPASLEKPLHVGAIEIPHTAVRFILYGYRFNEQVSARISYLRPVTFARYRNVDGEDRFHNVWMSVGGLTLDAQLPVSRKFSFGGEGGLAVVTRKGFKVNGEVAMKSVSYASFLLGAAFSYQLNEKWRLKAGSLITPAHGEARQPATYFHSAGFEYHLQPLSEEKIERNRKAGFRFPRQVLYAGYSTNQAGYGVNNFLSEGSIPVFWGGEAHVRRGFTLQYQRNIFHARKVFALDWAATLGAWQSNVLRQDFYTLSLSPVLKFNFLRSNNFDMGLEYSVAGPSFISRPIIDEKLTGSRFTFYDFMGLYGFAGRQKKIYTGLRIAHFSNGNMLYNNEGVKVPLTLNMGVAF